MCFVAIGIMHTWSLAYREVAPSLLYVTNLTRHVGPPIFLGHTWSLALEEQFYVAWPLLCVALYRYARPSWAWSALLLGAVAVACWRFHLYGQVIWTRYYDWPDVHADGLLIGCALSAS